MLDKSTFIPLLLLPIVACHSSTTPSASDSVAETMTEETTSPKTLVPTGDPEKDWILVEQAVDAWLYFNLSDFKSYEPLIRSTDYDAQKDIYIHHLRYRSMNQHGGMVTTTQDFQVDLNHPGPNSIPFSVSPIP